MNLFEEFGKGAVQSFGPAAGANFLTVKRHASLPAEANRILKAIASGEKEIDLGGAKLRVPPTVVVTAMRLNHWTFQPSLQLDVAFKMASLTVNVGEVNLVVQDGKPAVRVSMDSVFHPDILFIFDDAPEVQPDTDTITVKFDRLRTEAIQGAGVPVAKFDTVETALKSVQSTAAFHVATRAAFGTPSKERRGACRREANRVYAEGQKAGAIGTGLIFWFTVGKWILAALEWLIWLQSQREKDA